MNRKKIFVSMIVIIISISLISYLAYAENMNHDHESEGIQETFNQGISGFKSFETLNEFKDYLDSKSPQNNKLIEVPNEELLFCKYSESIFSLKNVSVYNNYYGYSLRDEKTGDILILNISAKQQPYPQSETYLGTFEDGEEVERRGLKGLYEIIDIDGKEHMIYRSVWDKSPVLNWFENGYEVTLRIQKENESETSLEEMIDRRREMKIEKVEQ